jgi:hypothetical protein
LNPKLVKFQFINENSNKAYQTKRDKIITASSDIIFPISVRENGNLAKLISQHSAKINNSFQTLYKSRKEKISYSLTDSNICQEIQNITAEQLLTTANEIYDFDNMSSLIFE